MAILDDDVRGIRNKPDPPRALFSKTTATSNEGNSSEYTAAVVARTIRRTRTW